MEAQHGRKEAQHKFARAQHGLIEAKHGPMEAQHRPMETQHRPMETQYMTGISIRISSNIGNTLLQQYCTVTLVTVQYYEVRL